MDFRDLNILSYVFQILKEWSALYGFDKKTIILSSYQNDINIPKALLKMGADRVIFYAPDEVISDDENITCINVKEKNLDEIPDNSVDLVLGYEILEHVNDLKNFFDNIKRVLKTDGKVDLQGNPAWTCQNGHHLWIKDKYIYNEKTNPFQPWEHLLLDTKEKMLEALAAKDIPQEDCVEICDWIFNPKEVSRHSPTEIISAAIGRDIVDVSSSKTEFFSSSLEQYSVDGFEYRFRRYFEKMTPHGFFFDAKEKYSELDLKTAKVVLRIEKSKVKKSESENSDYSPEYVQKVKASVVKRGFPELETCVSDIIFPFNKKHDCSDLKVLNLSCFENDKISQTFFAMGAKSVCAVSRNAAAFDENLSDVAVYQTYFENFEPDEDAKFDIVFGLDTLTNIQNIDKFLTNLKRVIKPDTAFYFSGFMPYTSPKGHLISYGKFNYFDGYNPLKPWQHLTLSTNKEFYDAMVENEVGIYTSQRIADLYFENAFATPISPTELITKFKTVADLHLKRIFKYYPKNEFYQIAAQKFSEEDLNTERFIITSDAAMPLDFYKIDMSCYFKENLSDINSKYEFANKKILNITPYVNYGLSEIISSMAAKEVVSFAPYYSGFELDSDKNIRCVNQDFEDLDNLDETFDIIYGLDILEHVKDLKKFYQNLIRLIDKNGVICVSGSPLWPSDNGHNFMDALDCGCLKTGMGSPSLDYWEHLAYDSKDELKKAMLDKGFDNNDAETVSEFVFNSKSINRKSFAEIIKVLDEFDNICYGSRKILDFAEENEFYKKASEKYSHEELRTKELKLFIRKKPSWS